MIKKINILFIPLMLTALAFGQSVTIEQVRQMYFGGWEGLCGATRLTELLSEINSDKNPVLMAYRGAAISTTANCKKMPYAKWNTFNEGKALIEKAVAYAPNDIEVRFLRFTIQSNIPGFLNYNHLVEDKRFIINTIKSDPLAVKSDSFISVILTFLRDSDQLVGEDKKWIDSMIAQL